MEACSNTLLTENSPQFLSMSAAERKMFARAIRFNSIEILFSDENYSVLMNKNIPSEIYVLGKITEIDLKNILEIGWGPSKYALSVYVLDKDCELFSGLRIEDYQICGIERHILYADSKDFENKFQQAIHKFESKNPNLKIIYEENKLQNFGLSGSKNRQKETNVLIELLNAENKKLSGLIIERESQKIVYFISNESSISKNNIIRKTTIQIRTLNNILVSENWIESSESCVVRTVDDIKFGNRGFGNLVTAFSFRAQISLEGHIMYGVTSLNLASIAIMNFFKTSKDLVKVVLDLEKVQDYLQKQSQSQEEFREQSPCLDSSNIFEGIDFTLQDPVQLP